MKTCEVCGGWSEYDDDYLAFRCWNGGHLEYTFTPIQMERRDGGRAKREVVLVGNMPKRTQAPQRLINLLSDYHGGLHIKDIYSGLSLNPRYIRALPEDNTVFKRLSRGYWTLI